MQPTKQIFISHSSKDKELIEVIRSYFDGTGVAPLGSFFNSPKMTTISSIPFFVIVILNKI